MYAFRANNDENLQEQILIARELAQHLPLVLKDEIEIQVFRTSIGVVWRVLEYGYGLKNKLWKQPDVFPQCNYDNRTEIPDKDIPNEVIVDEIDNLIDTEQYVIISL